MCDKHNSVARTMHINHRISDLPAQLPVQITRRFIRYDKFWLCSERSSDSDSLLLTTTHMIGEEVFFFKKIESDQDISDEGMVMCDDLSQHLKWIDDILSNGMVSYELVDRKSVV